jgi:hypothetical protein
MRQCNHYGDYAKKVKWKNCFPIPWLDKRYFSPKRRPATGSAHTTGGQGVEA